MPDIKIFISHRIDINSELVNNPLYVPIRCGAIFDKENPMNIAGDDTGDNISERRMSFCEFTVQYWAWKNCEADYYGLCHYRRYLSFAKKTFPTDGYNVVHNAVFLPYHKKKYGLLNEHHIEELIHNYDIIVSEPALVSRIPISKKKHKTVSEFWQAMDDHLLEKANIEYMFDLIDKMYPEYSNSAREYFSKTWHRGFNCYVMKKQLFQRLCEFQFSIMFEVEKRINSQNPQNMKRTPAFIGEMLYGVFIYHITTYESWKVKEQQLIFFRSTEAIKNKITLTRQFILNYADKLLRILIDPLFPKCSKQREILKTIFFKITKAKNRGPTKSQ